jgi:hypothetical protein
VIAGRPSAKRLRHAMRRLHRNGVGRIAMEFCAMPNDGKGPLWARLVAGVIGGIVATLVLILAYKAIIWAIHL